MKNTVFYATLICIFSINIMRSQNIVVKPSAYKKPIYFDITKPLRGVLDLNKKKVLFEEEKERNAELRIRNYPFKETALPKGDDAVWQKRMGTNQLIKGRETEKNFAGQAIYSLPSDCNGDIGNDYFMQSVNAQYVIYDRNGNIIVSPKQMNTLFEGVAGSDENDGDPIVMYDSQAERWLAAEFSGVDSDPDYMMIAISETDDPTGSWYRWSWETNGFPDYMKFGVWKDGYYMGVNASGNGEDDIYVFERDKMLVGDASPSMVAFNNPNRPNSGFHAVLPMDNDGEFAPDGTPGQFITINDDAWGNGGDALWVFELNVDWNAPSNSTFERTQVISVSPFDSDFGSNLKNIKQKGTSQEVDAIPQVLMNKAQYRNFGDHQTVVCTHTVDVDDTDHAGLRWYELINTGSGWSIRQQGTYAPDGDSRWMASIAMNGNKDIGIGYNISSSNLYPSIRYTGQSAEENANASGEFDVVETSLKVGEKSQTGSDRWGDYSSMSIDPTDDNTFWFTTEYQVEENRKGTRIAAFSFAPPPLSADFIADNTAPCKDEIVKLTDKSSGNPSSWNWSFSPSSVTFVNGTTANSENPDVKFNSTESYDITLSVSDGTDNDTKTKNDYINVSNIIADFTASPILISEGETVTFTDLSKCDPVSWEWSFEGGDPASYTGQNPPDINYYISGSYSVSLTVTNSNGDEVTETKSGYITVDSPDILMSDDQKTTCSANFYDSGGKSDDYSDDEDFVLTVEPSDISKKLKLEFTSFNVQADNNCEKDYLEIYDGASTNATLIGKYCGTDLPQSIESSEVGGKLTFHFVSDNPFFSNSTEAGWESKFSCVSSSLPLEVFEFTAGKYHDQNIISWSTIAEKSIEWFSVEKSFDGIDFKSYQKILPKCKSKNGINKYSIKDNSPFQITYYRLRSMDINGRLAYSKVVKVERKVASKLKVIDILPNPAIDYIDIHYYVDIERDVYLYIYSFTGRIMKMKKLCADIGDNTDSINIRMLPSGVYIVKIFAGGEQSVEKIVKK